MSKFNNLLKHKLQKGDRAAGAWLQLASPFTAEILSQAGFDFLMIDLEHGPGDILTLIAQIEAMKGSPASPLVRATWNDFVLVKRILDAGAYGILFPYINTAEEAEAAVRSCRYPPDGIRGLAGSPRAAGYGQNSMDYLKYANEEIFVMTAVETPEAAANLDEILEVKGLEGIFIGPMDLATSMGYFAAPGNPEVQAMIRSIEEKVLASGKVLATISNSWEQAQQRYERGYQMLMLMADGVSLGNLASELISKFRAAYPNRSD
jgi:2-dehydro-3-deoxyglucarate aldolase/4-hydroxy-2-oxoheptanedioate aldolase